LEKWIHRRATSQVMVGGVGIGGMNPVRIQSMTSTPTSDTRATVEQALRIAAAGADLVRMTVQNKKEAENLENIKRELRAANCFIPLVADVHFNPAIAEIAAAIVDKVRINPGNYGISQGKPLAVVSDQAYQEELQAARTAFSRLLDICRIHGTALRIGVNHGSLAPRIINRYGNTPAGMVRSALEFLGFCIEKDFHDIIVSLKSSNILVMVQANRMMAGHMDKEGWKYPLHLGVTEAGEGEDGRIRSVAGIGTLLSEGTGDTIRVSLTEDPEMEIPVAQKLIKHLEKHYSVRENTISHAENSYDSPGRPVKAGFPENAENKHSFSIPGDDLFKKRLSRSTRRIMNIGGEQVPVVIGDFNPFPDPAYNGGPLADYLFEAATEKDNSVTRDEQDEISSPWGKGPGRNRKKIVRASVWQKHYREADGIFPLLSTGEYLSGNFSQAPIVFLEISSDDFPGQLPAGPAADDNLVFVALSQSACPPVDLMKLVEAVKGHGYDNPVIFKKQYDIDDDQDFLIAAAADFTPLFIEGTGEGIWLTNTAGSTSLCISTAFSLLQSARVRTSKTEFISCPSCGRTMFNIQKATAAVKMRTSHLRGLTIAVMGCIVNGPGEMADADYGYVGSGKGRVNLYKKQEVYKRNVPEETALDELISLIRENGDWTDP
jgi:(E)-4-hydroxy-3-methylbut-2-enyl-diphosphate synthase